MVSAQLQPRVWRSKEDPHPYYPVLSGGKLLSDNDSVAQVKARLWSGVWFIKEGQLKCSS